MKHTIALAAIIAALATGFPARAADIEGLWATFDDGGKPTGFVRIYRQGEVYDGIAAGGLPDDDPNRRCTACQGDLAGHKMLGLPIITGVRQDGDEYSGGRILDPFSGKDYDVVLTPLADGKQLKVRGFLGARLFGRTQVWRRAP